MLFMYKNKFTENSIETILKTDMEIEWGKAKYLFGYTCTDLDDRMQIILHMYKVACFSYR